MAAVASSAIQRSQVDLSDFVDWSGVECLNQSPNHSIPNALKQGYREDDGLVLESDADEQLLLYIPFNQVIKLHSVVIQGPEDEERAAAFAAANQRTEGIMTRCNIGALSSLPQCNLRSGSVESVVSMLSKAAIPTGFKWVPIEGLPTNIAIKHAAVFVKCAMLQMSKNSLTIMDAETTRKAAILIGVARAVMTELYAIQATDLIPGETEPWMLSYSCSNNAEGVPVVAWATATELTAEHARVLKGSVVFSETEQAVMSDIVMCAIGLPAVQGASLMTTGHHYISDAREKSRALYKVIEGQFWKKDPMKAWMATNTDLLRDALWHKAGHPISIPLKMQLASSGEVAKSIVKAGAGSAASRLPAKEAGLKTAETVVTLATNVRPFFEQYGGSLNTAFIEAAIACVHNYIPGVAFGGGGMVVRPGVDETFERHKDIPDWVVDRKTALEFLELVVNRNQDATATAFGFFEAYCEGVINRGSIVRELTLLKANSLMKLKESCFASYAMGADAYSDYKMFMGNQRAEGKYLPPNLN